jgi:hypothetical protein
VETVVEVAAKYISEELPKRLLEWNEVFQHACKTLKNNNGNLINQARPHLAISGYAFLFFPMLQLIHSPKLKL